jgi:hypothetical protein
MASLYAFTGQGMRAKSHRNGIHEVARLSLSPRLHRLRARLQPGSSLCVAILLSRAPCTGYLIPGKPFPLQGMR